MEDMEQLISVSENGISFAVAVDGTGDARFLHFSPSPFQPHRLTAPGLGSRFRLVEVQVTGENQDDHHGSKHTGTLPGGRLKYVNHTDIRNHFGRKLAIHLRDPQTQLLVSYHIQFFDGLPIVRTWTDVENHGSLDIGLEYVSSFAMTLSPTTDDIGWENRYELYIPHNAWCNEAQWRRYRLPDLGLSENGTFSTKTIAVSNTGTWSSSQHLPIGMLRDLVSHSWYAWQIEHNGSWHWEIGDVGPTLYFQLSGPTEQENGWWKCLRPSERFTTVPVAVGTGEGDAEASFAAFTEYRRRIRKPHHDNEQLPVIYNEYVLTDGNPTTDIILSQACIAADMGCEVFCIDAGWYADGPWWSGVGEWLPSTVRFPSGIEEAIRHIREQGMVPGLWLEIEVMGIDNPLASRLPDDWFFCRHGKRVVDHGRYQLDFRNPAVAEYANQVVDRLVNTYGVGYIKMDYNINGGIGTDVQADSAGDGLLMHNRAYLNWLDELHTRYPHLTLENCASGGLRMDYAVLSRLSLQSVTDQGDFRRIVGIAAAAPSAVTPEQCAIWTFPSEDTKSGEELAFSVVNALLLRMYLSGNLANLHPHQEQLIREGIRCYKAIRSDITASIPFWPLGLPKGGDGWLSLGLCNEYTRYLAVWRLDSDEQDCSLPIVDWRGLDVAVECIYPAALPTSVAWDREAGCLRVRLAERIRARVFKLWVPNL